MPKLKSFLKAHWLQLVAALMAIATTGASLYWMCLLDADPAYLRYLRYENSQAMFLFAFALIPISLADLGRAVLRKLHLNDLWCAGAFLALSALCVSMLFDFRGSVYFLRVLTFIAFALILLVTGPVNTETSRWLLPAFGISGIAWLAGKFLLGGGNSFGLWCAAAVAASVLGSAWAQKALNRRTVRRVVLYLVISVLVPLIYAGIFEPAAVQKTIAIWRDGSVPTVTFCRYGITEKATVYGIGIAIQHLLTAAALVIAARTRDGSCRHTVTHLVLTDLVFLLLGLLCMLGVIPAAIVIPTGRLGMLGVIFPCLVVNSLLYSDSSLFGSEKLREHLTPASEDD